MKNFKVHGFQATLIAGLVQLSDKQAHPRSAALQLLKEGGVVEAAKPIRERLTAAAYSGDRRRASMKLVKVVEAAKDAAGKADDKIMPPAVGDYEMPSAFPAVGIYQITAPINFKRLEEFGWDGKPSRLQESQQFHTLKEANEIIARQERERVEKQKKQPQAPARDPRAQRGNLR
jgi:hypothetical protein